jgi:hypothetical protein
MSRVGITSVHVDNVTPPPPPFQVHSSLGLLCVELRARKEHLDIHAHISKPQIVIATACSAFGSTMLPGNTASRDLQPSDREAPCRRTDLAVD